MTVSCIISEIPRYWLKNSDLLYLLHSTSPLGAPRRNIAITFDVEELE